MNDGNRQALVSLVTILAAAAALWLVFYVTDGQL